MPPRAHSFRYNIAAFALNATVRTAFWGVGIAGRAIQKRLDHDRAALRHADPYGPVHPAADDPLAS